MHLRKSFVVALFVLTCSTLSAQEYGSISGVVTDNFGEVLPGASVSVAGPSLPQGRQVETDSGGRYQFLNLPPETYTVDATLAGLGNVSRRAVVSVAKDTQVNLSLSPTVVEHITVSAEFPAVDVKSTEVNFNYSGEEIVNLPVGRTYQGLLALIPGVADNEAFAGGINAGGSRQDNQFYVDGANLTNPYFGHLGIEINALDIQDFNVKKGGYEPEFGRSAGLVTNAITRSGTNELKGSLLAEYQPREFRADSKWGVEDPWDRFTPAFSIGGPLLRDRIFGYASGSFFRGERTGRSNWLGPVPDQTLESDELFGKLTISPTATHLIELGYRDKPITNEFAGVGNNETPSVATNSEGTDRVGSFHWTWAATQSTFVEAKYVDAENEGSSVAVTQLGERGAFDPNNLPAMGLVFDPTIPLPNHPTPGNVGAFIGGASLARSQVTYQNREAKVSVTQFFDLGRTAHEVKGGFGWQEGSEELLRVSNAWGLIRPIQGGAQFSAIYYPDQPAQVGTGTTYSIYLQDRIQIGERWVVNAGVLANNDEFSQTTDEERTFLSFGYGDEIQPRVGFTYSLRPAEGDKIYGHYGRSYLLDQKSSARSLAPRRLFDAEAIFDLQGNVISNNPRSSTVSKNISPDIVPPYTDEILVGYATPLGSIWSVDTYFMYRMSENFIEDFPRVEPNSSYIYDNIEYLERKYRAVTVNLRRALTNRWMFETNYTWSKLYGNYDQDYYASYGDQSGTGAIFNTSSGLFDGPGSFFNEPNHYGPLANDRTHVLKALGTYDVLTNLTLGGILRFQSGSPWNARGLDWNGRYLVYLEPAGAHRGPSITNLDLLARYRVPLGGRVGVSVEGRVFNALDDQEPLAMDPRVDLGGRIRVGAPPWIAQPTSNPNPNYGRGLYFASPRRFIASVKIDF